MKAFIWTPRFETGLATVDEQHHHLVDVINHLGEVMIQGGGADAVTAEVFQDLAAYAQFHFADEERLMREAGLSGAHVSTHCLHHREFVEQLGGIWKSRNSLAQPAEVLHAFLSSWLTFHILEEDQAMARQLLAVAGGVAPEVACQREQTNPDTSSAVLLAAMSELYRVLSQQNKALAKVNERLEAEVTERTRNLLQSEKMAAIGQLAAGVAHEINNPIGFVKSNLGTLGGYSEQLLRLVQDCEAAMAEQPALAQHFAGLAEREDLAYIREDLPTLLGESREGLDRVSGIVLALKDFAHADSAEMVETDLVSGLESTLKVANNELKYKAEVVRQLQPVPHVMCVPGQINQVFMNLLVNAAQAIQTRGTITLRSGHDAAGVWVEIADTGCGIAPENLSRLFEPFYTTKPVGKGTGLGLSISWDIIVKNHGGRIEASSEPGQGSCFRVWLPR
jgi:hemerythrin-like metal-binding protein